MSDSPFAYCERLARGHYENFPVGWFLPKRVRPYIYALYAFARTADDFADEEICEKQKRLAQLSDWSERLKEAKQGRADHPVFQALSKTFRETTLEADLLEDLLTAFRWDVEKNRYTDFGELEEYCRYSANPIGRAVLQICGYTGEELFQLSDRICTGIQLVNHWQDVAIDLEKDRIYLPQEDLERFGYSYEELRDRQANQAFRSLMRFEFERTRALFYEGRPLFGHLPRRLRWQVELMWAGPQKILDKIEESHFNLFGHRPTLSKRELVQLFWNYRIGRR